MGSDIRWNFAAVWDLVASTVPNQTALIEGEIRRDWQTYEDRCARLASALMDLGVQKDSKVAIYGYNSASWVEAYYAISKTRAAAVNVNYRYTENELEYLLDNADAEVVFFDSRFSKNIDDIRKNLPKLKAAIAMDDGSGQMSESALEMEKLVSSNKPLVPQDYSGQDLYIVYTGGTTGMPKGVVYHVGEICRLLIGASFGPYTSRQQRWSDIREGIENIHLAGEVPVGLSACPYMHGIGLSMGILSPHVMGGCVAVYPNRHLDADALLRLIESSRATEVAIVGDAFAKPLISELRRASSENRPYDLSSLKRIRSSGAILSSESKQALLEFADVSIMDTMGASEGSLGVSVVSRDSGPGTTGTFLMGPTTKVFNENFQEIQPGSDEIGMVASSTIVPVEYYKDPEKSKATFKEINGTRYSFPGDYAKVASDGTLILMGRGSNCINTGGEKVYPEEVEETLKRFPGVVDSLVIGVPDDRFGQKVVGIIQALGESVDPEALIEFSREYLAGYKIPRSILFTEKVQRGPNGKADYKWAKGYACKQLGIEA